jgi:hypothetical protein
MRLAGQEKAGYYPTPTELLAPISNWIAPFLIGRRPKLQYRILDPCAGDGEALYRIAARYEGLVMPFAIELDHDRAARLKVREFSFGLGRSLAADAFDSLVEPESMALLYLNPPYDSAYEVKGVRRQRTELLFLKQFTPTLLAPGGVLVYVIPHSLLRNTATSQIPGRPLRPLHGGPVQRRQQRLSAGGGLCRPQGTNPTPTSPRPIAWHGAG